MARKTSILKESFNAGEFGQRMAARVQFDKHVNAGATYQNILPLPQGGFTYRPGNRFVAAAMDASVKPVLIPLVHSTGQSYMLELGEKSMRSYRKES